MKLISSSHAIAALHVSGDEVLPLGGVMSRDLLAMVGDAYQFAVRPSIPEGIPPFAIPVHAFQSGVLVKGDEKLPIIQLSLVANGDIVAAYSTDAADAVLDDLMERLDKELGYRYATAKQRRTYQSNVVVQFDWGIEEKIEALSKIERLLERLIPRPNAPFKIKRLAFGYGDITPPMIPISLDAVGNSDFLIERRAGEPYSENRYFSSAPTRTAEHLKILEAVEEALSG